MSKILNSLIRHSKSFTITEKIDMINEFQKTKDINVANELVSGYYKMIVKNANSIKNSPTYKFLDMISVEDLVNACIIGVHESLHKVNTEYQYAIDSYIMNWGREHMYREVRKNYGAVMTPSTKLASLRKLEKIMNKNEGDLEKSLDIFFEGQKNSLSKKKVLRKVYLNKVSSISIDSCTNDDDDSYNGDSSLHNFISDKTNDIDQFYKEKECKELLDNVFNNILDEDEKNIVKKYHGFDNSKMTYKQIANDLNMTQTQVYQINRKALNKLKKVKELELYK